MKHIRDFLLALVIVGIIWCCLLYAGYNAWENDEDTSKPILKELGIL